MLSGAGSSRLASTGEVVASRPTTHKLPEITAFFWVMKVLATTLGETGGDLVAQTLKVGYVVSSMIFVAALFVSVVGQITARRFHPALYWSVIAFTCTAGTTMSDYLNRGFGGATADAPQYARGAAILVAFLIVVFVIWKFTGQTFNVEQITTSGGELLYWTAILFSNTLGTSFGDFLADTSGLGFGGSALVILAIMALILGIHYRTRVSKTLLFWLAFVLTRPLGATVGDFFTKPIAKGGLNLGTLGSSIVLTSILAAGVAWTLWRHDHRDTVEANAAA
ncbi:MAG: hypothetical protein LC792_19045 [Actinobacteria bacterium]|nr:hypothetical protein [Actinomycetota bacterium]